MKYIWKYKDANRVWWRLETEMDRPAETGLDPDDPDHIWSYRLINDDDNVVVFTGEVWGQYNLMPNMNQYLADIQNQVNHLCLGMAKYCGTYETTNEQ